MAAPTCGRCGEPFEIDEGFCPCALVECEGYEAARSPGLGQPDREECS